MRTVDHEYRHAQQEQMAGGEPDFDEGDAEDWRLSKTAGGAVTSPHPNYSTGQPCYCGFGPKDAWQLKTAAKLQDFLMNPKSRPDLQTPEAQAFLQHLEQYYHNAKTDALMPWLVREWKKGRLEYDPALNTSITIPGLNGRYHYHVSVRPSDLNHWGDFLRSNHPIRRNLGDIMQHDVSSFHAQQAAWNQAMEDEAHQKALEGGQVVHTTPEGYTVRQLHTPEELTAEGNAMGHCVGGYADDVANGQTSIYSLRDPQGTPHATVEIEPNQYRYDPEEALSPSLQQAINTTPVPHGGNIVQIQGKANREPEPEYKRQLKHWFESFSPEERPTWDSHEAIDRPGWAAPGIDDYGVENKSPVDYPGYLENMLHEDDYPHHHQHDFYNSDWGRELYDHARHRGQIPEFGHAVERFSQEQNDDFQDWRNQNYEHTVPYPDEEDENHVDEYGDPISYDEALKAYDDNLEQWEADHPGMQAANHLYSLLNRHQLVRDPTTGYDSYSNELAPPESSGTFSAVTPEETQILDDLSLRSVAHNLHYKFEQGTQEPAAILDYAKRLLKLIGYPEDDMHVQAALQAWQTMYPQDRVLQKVPDVAQIEAAPTPESVHDAPATTPTESWGYGTVSSDRIGAMDYAPYDLDQFELGPEDWEMPEFQPWQRGTEGKGLIDPEGQLHTWGVNDYGEPHHDVVSQQEEIPYVAKVNIHPTGMAAVPSPDSLHLFGVDRPTAEQILAEQAPKHGLRFDNRFIAGVKEPCPECGQPMDYPDYCNMCGKSTEPTQVMNPDDHWHDWHEQPAGKAKEYGELPIGNDYVA
jgi:hypothetical protein